MSKKLSILNADQSRRVEVPNACRRLCAQCLDPMRLDYYYWTSQTNVTIMYKCEHPETSRFKLVLATLDKKGRLS